MLSRFTLYKVSSGLFQLIDATGEVVAEITAPSRPQAVAAAAEWLATGERNMVTFQTEQHFPAH